MKAVRAAAIRALDRRAIDEGWSSEEELMDRAGAAVAAAIERFLALDRKRDVLLLAGKGNNGGDAYVAARYLAEKGHRVEVWLACAAADTRGAARQHFERMTASGIRVREKPAPEDWSLTEPVPEQCILVDGLLGTGAAGAPHGVAAAAIAWLEKRAPRAVAVVAIDLPSGVHPDTGETEGPAVVADLTVTFVVPKKGLLTPAGLSYAGFICVADIGIPLARLSEDEWEPSPELLTEDEVASLFQRRARDSHKGSFGRVLLIGGAAGYGGAITLAAGAAVRSGAGLVTVITPASVAPVVTGRVPEAMVRAAPESPAGSLAYAGSDEWRTQLNDFDAVLVGPGMTARPDTLHLMRDILRESTVPLVADADALNVFAGQAHWFGRSRCPVVVTPHPGEMGRLLKRTAEQVQADRVVIAGEAVAQTGATVVLKGAGSVVAGPGKIPVLNTTGNPGMATGGAGDVLAGLLAGLMAQGLEAWDAARAAVYIHGRAGDLAALRGSQAGLTAGDVIRSLPLAQREVMPR